MSYHVEIARPAQIEIKALPAHVRAQLRQLINSLKEIPRPARAKELRDKPIIAFGSQGAGALLMLLMRT